MKLKKVLPITAACAILAGCGMAANVAAADTSGTTMVDYSSLPQGTFAVRLRNQSTFSDKDVYVNIVNLPFGRVSYLSLGGKRTLVNGPAGLGSVATINTATPSASCASNMQLCAPITSIRLSDIAGASSTAGHPAYRTLYLPASDGVHADGQYYGSRIYISEGKPLSMVVNSTANGYVQPDVENPSDPNYSIPFDWFEFTYNPAPQQNNASLTQVAFGGNVTQVDSFSIPLSFTVTGEDGTTITRGIQLPVELPSGKIARTRADLINGYLQATKGTPFDQLVQKDAHGNLIRLISPYHSSVFRANGPGAHYFDGYVDQVWNTYKSKDLVAYDQPGEVGNLYKGRVQGNNFVVTRNGGAPFSIAKPTTYDVLTNNGALQPGGIDANAFGAQLSAALNRHVAEYSDTWQVTPGSPSSYYKTGPYNAWSKFWHNVSIDGLAYGFGFDDVSNQSSVAILPANEKLKELTLVIGG